MLIAVRFWILLSTLLVSAGWILSALHQLNRTGYGVVFLLAAIAAVFWRQKWCPQKSPAQLRRRFNSRFKRPAPFLFLLVAMLAGLSGALYPALNFDANSYRLPRVFHWLWAGQWHWIHTFDARMNISACGTEWLSAPLILFTRTDRFLFLINWLSYLMLPGLIFSVFTRLQVRPRVAWWWMWFLAAGWCFALQAGSIANDSLAAVYILAAVDLALRAREKKSLTDLWLSLLAAALATGVKQTNLPLALLWLIAAWPSLRLLWRQSVGSVLVAAFGLLVSIVPISVLNYEHYGTWLPVEVTGIATLGKFHLNPFWGIIGNAFCIPAQNLLPPFYELLPPFYAYWVPLWNEFMRDFLQTPFGAHFSSFENFGYLSGVYYHGVSEGNAGLGLGVCILILASIHEIRKQKRLNAAPAGKTVRYDSFLSLLRLAPWGLLLVFMAKVGTFENARHLAPYYAFLFPLFLIKPGHVGVVRQRQWQRLGLAIMIFTAVLVATSSDRPLFPAQTIFGSLRGKFPDNEVISEQCARYLESNYQITAARRNYLDQSLPPDEKVIGYYAAMCDVDEPGIWLPYGRRGVECIAPDDSPARLRALGIHYVVVHGAAVHQQNGSITNWMIKFNARLVGCYNFHKPSPWPVFRSPPPPDLYLVQLN
jgi:hypothetical protein